MGKKFVKCACGVTDVSRAGHVGTSVTMRCPDCADRAGLAASCRNCCPSGHHTRYTPTLDALLASGAVRKDVASRSYVGHTEQGPVQVGSLDDANATEVYLVAHPTPDTW